MSEEKPTVRGRLAIVDNLVEGAKADTLYCDLYFSRARSHLQQEMTRENYRNLTLELSVVGDSNRFGPTSMGI